MCPFDKKRRLAEKHSIDQRDRPIDTVACGTLHSKFKLLQQAKKK